MDKRIDLVSPDGGTEVEVFESSAKAMIAKGWKLKTELKPAKPKKEGK